MSNLVLIDGNAVVHRAYHSMPKTFTDPKGNPTNAVYGFALTLIRVIEDLKPEYVVCSFDLAGPTFRHDKFEAYKATRIKADQELYDQIPVIKQLVETFGIKILEMQGFEADDIIGTVVKKITNHKSQISNKSQITNSKSQTNNEAMKQSNNDVKTYIVTGDKDTFQLVNGDVFVYDLKQGANGPRIINRDTIKAKYDLEPEDFIDLKALAGDASDNIPGVPGIGDKTAVILIKSFGTLNLLYLKIADLLEKYGLISKSKFQMSNQIQSPKIDNSEIEKLTENWKLEIGNYDKKIGEISESLNIKIRILELLIDFRDQAYLSQELATIHKNVPIEFTLEDLRWGEYDRENLRRLFEELGFRSLLARFGRVSSAQELKYSRTEEHKTEVQKKDTQLKLL